ncbi:hypothetical protein [Kitasatospora sp. NBC_01302]|uniref:hypothetical protein n=1 Tax=Kitasatospora sp. NBC_01302 TaxID=2903575 RepID=UPI002E155F8A|nr:hypothetical protein OG294_27705 [Kitasatospora sp. NBC_01302]
MTAAVAVQLAADRTTVENYLTQMYAGLPGYLSICSDADRFTGKRFGTDQAGITKAVEHVMRLDRRRPKGIYAQVTTLREHPTEGRGGEDLALGLGYLWADGDYGTTGHSPSRDDLPHPPDADTVRKIVADSGLPDPTGWSLTGGGLNPMWMLAEPHPIGDEQDRARIKEFTTSTQAILGASAYRAGYSWDVGVGDLARIMRLPGTINRKTDEDRQTTVSLGSGALYTLNELIEVVTQLAPAAHATMAQAASEKQQRAAQRQQKTVPAPRATATAPRPGDGPLDVLGELMRFGDLLRPAGFTFEGYHSDGREKWLRPAGADGRASSAHSLLCDDHVAVNWSERSDLPVGAQPPGRKLTIGTLFAHLHYGGDVSAAAKDIMRAAAGLSTTGAAGALPFMLLAEVKRRCMTGPDRRTAEPSFADEDWTSLVETASSDGDEPAGRARRIPGLLPEEFYAGREVHRQIRLAGHSRTRSGDVAVLSCLTRLSAMVSHHIRADTGVGGHASLNLFGGIIGPSGIGKSTGVDVSTHLMPAPEGLDLRDGLPIGSGEGLAEVFMDVVERETGNHTRKGDPIMERVRAQVRHNAFFYVDEGATLTRLMKERSGSTLGETLRSAAVGQTLGQTNASKDTSRYIPSGSYSLGLLVGFQPETVAPLFEETAEGTPQRFLWTQVVDPSIPDKQPTWPGELYAWKKAIKADQPTLISFEQEIKDELRRADLAKARGEVAPQDMNPLDSHAPLMRVKIASLLAILSGRHHVDLDDWRFAEMVWAASCETRDWAIAYSARQRQLELEKRTQARIIEEVRIDRAKAEAEATAEEKTVERIAKSIAAKIHQNGPTSRSDLGRTLASRDRRHRDAALDYAVLRDWVALIDSKIAPGGSRPS